MKVQRKGVTAPVAPVSPYSWQMEDRTWRDTGRGRDVPVRIFAPGPEAGEGPFPLVVFSHGGGESRDSFGYLGRAWATSGFCVVCLQHLGGDIDAFRRMVRERSAPETAEEKYGRRREDINFVLDVLESRRLDSPLLAGRMDFSRLSISGQCAGSTSALATVGLSLRLPGDARARFVDRRSKAVVALGPQLPYPTAGGGEFGVHEQSWSTISPDAPVLIVTGTKDFSWIPEVAEKPDRVRMPYDRTPGKHKYLLELRGAEHHAFTESTNPGYAEILPLAPRNPRHHAAIAHATTAFLNAYLKDDVPAGNWLRGRSLEASSAGLCKQENR